jgi:hypothetical protein
MAQYTKESQRVVDAIAQLQQSERGQAALGEFLDYARGEGWGLDNDNWSALATLCETMASPVRLELIETISGKRRFPNIVTV